jgi:hypothetical protein
MDLYHMRLRDDLVLGYEEVPVSNQELCASQATAL